VKEIELRLKQVGARPGSRCDMWPLGRWKCRTGTCWTWKCNTQAVHTLLLETIGTKAVKLLLCTTELISLLYI